MLSLDQDYVIVGPRLSNPRTKIITSWTNNNERELLIGLFSLALNVVIVRKESVTFSEERRYFEQRCLFKVTVFIRGDVY